MEPKLYQYNAYVTEVYDGDTCTVDIDLGLHTWLKDEKIRLARINAPELRGDERDAGFVSRDFLRSLILKKSVILETIKDQKGKYGRYLGELWIIDDNGNYFNINDHLVDNGYAVYQSY
ncbi:thermonuclease family protein [candidate division KSB1 bacterium]|nr:thermonuclease family protein [candidate division KSB1 bacterium]